MNKRVETMAQDLWHFVFEMLDAEPNEDAIFAGKVAREIEERFKEIMGEEG